MHTFVAIWRRCLAAALLAGIVSSPAFGEATQVRIGRALSIGYLPLMVMEDQRLLEKHAKAAGLGDVTVEYVALTGGSALNDALLANSLQIASGGVAPFLLLWSRTQGNAGVRALSPFNSLTLYLNTRNAEVRSVRDFSAHDRIAVLTSKSSIQAILLQMEAARAFGQDNYTKLDTLTVSMPLADAAAQLMTGSKGSITADFTLPPFSYQEIATPGIRNLITSNDILGGPATYTMAYTTSAFFNANPKLNAAFVSGLNEAIDIINRDRKLAGDIFVRVSKSNTPRATVDRMLSDPNITFETVPQRLGKFAEFMHAIGTLRTLPASWKDLFFPGAVQDGKGS
ncbi:MAG TPA: ABC transporter substrate-binding protein [Casimicrobiaceae bacterium]|nr:ABC transporter substrate-binding protein [Casimicrobiaceae bacterium]